MRTTIDIPDEVYRRLKAKAALDGSTVKQAILTLVTRELDAEAPRTRVRFPIIHGKENRILNLTNEQINEILFD